VTHRILLAILTASGPALATAAGAQAPGAEMRAFFQRDGRDSQVPLFSELAGSMAVARVDGEEITLRQLMQALAESHQGRGEGPAKQHDFRPVLDRLIDIKLCALEAREMALDDLPDVKKAIEQEEQSEIILRVRARAVKDAKAAPADVERFYRDAVREWNLRSLLFDKEVDAAGFQKRLQGGSDFGALGKQLIADKKAKGTTESGYAGASAMLPQVLDFVRKAKTGTSKVVKVPEGWSVVQVIGARYPDNPQARAKAQARAAEAAKDRAAKRYYEALQKRYATIDWKLFDAVDFEAKKPSFAELKKDKRVIAAVNGEKPFTVGDLAAGLEMKFFHGIDSPIREHRVNAAKHDTFRTLLRKRLVLKEAHRLGIATSAEFRQYMAEFHDATLFTAYLERAVMPDVKVSEKEGQEYYEKNKAEFTVPAMYKLESLTFGTARDAQATLEKLRSGTDFKWLRANAPGQVKESDRSAQLDGTTVSATALTPGLRAQLAGAKEGDYRLEGVEGQFYVLRVVSVVPQQVQTYQQARGAIGKKLIGANLQKTLAETAQKLRSGHQVAVYLTKIGY
jgi:hypothetical protein